MSIRYFHETAWSVPRGQKKLKNVIIVTVSSGEEESGLT